MKLFRVKVQSELVVAADSAAEANQIAISSIYQLDAKTDFVACSAGEVSSVDSLPTGWDAECVPLGGDGNTRIREFIPDVAAEPEGAES